MRNEDHVVDIQQKIGEFVHGMIDKDYDFSDVIAMMFVFSANEMINGFPTDTEGMAYAQSLLDGYWETKAQNEQAAKQKH